jgi:hypothetical protein
MPVPEPITEPGARDDHGFAVGERITGRCVTRGATFTGTIMEILPETAWTGGHNGEYRYRLTDTGKHYVLGGPIEPIVECPAHA